MIFFVLFFSEVYFYVHVFLKCLLYSVGSHSCFVTYLLTNQWQSTIVYSGKFCFWRGKVIKKKLLSNICVIAFSSFVFFFYRERETGWSEACGSEILSRTFWKKLKMAHYAHISILFIRTLASVVEWLPNNKKNKTKKKTVLVTSQRAVFSNIGKAITSLMVCLFFSLENIIINKSN